MLNNYSGILEIEVVVPEKKLSLLEISLLSGMNVDDLEKKVGFKEKPILDKDQNIADLALMAAKKLLAKTNTDEDAINLIIHASCGIHKRQLYSPAAKIQKELGVKKAFAFDIQNGCNSGNLALNIAANYLSNHHENDIALIVAADALSSLVNYQNENHRCIFNFSDAASAVLVRKNRTRSRLLSFSGITNSSFADSIYKPINSDYAWLNDDPEEDKRLAQEYECRYVSSILDALGKANKTISDISYVVMNQGDHRLFDKLSKKLSLSEHQIIRTYHQWGHLGSSDIFFGLKKLINDNLVKPGSIIVLASSAIGFSWGASVIEV